MSVRVRVLLGGISVVLLAIFIMAFYVADHERDVYTAEVENRARILLASLAAPCVSALSQNRIEDLDRLVEEFHTRLSDTADVRTVSILDNRRRVMGHTDKSLYGRILSDPFTLFASEEDGPVIQYIRDEEMRVVRVAQPLTTSVDGLPGIRWGTLAAELDLSRETEVLSGFIWRSMRVMLGFALLTATLLYFLAERFYLRPVVRLGQAVDKLRDGDLTARAQLTGNSEISRVGATFDAMAAELERHTDSLHELVKERTQAVDRANEELTATMERLKLANQQLSELARTDALTGLPNRRHFKETLAFYFELAKRGGRPLAFAMIDVDHFKHYNDTHGHPAGDRVLQDLADIFRLRLRQTDVPSRYGGEEFAVLFLDTALEQATNVAEALRKRVAYHEFSFGDQQPGGCLSISIGVADLTPAMEEPMDLVACADKALYRAKKEGRNRVVVEGQTLNSSNGSQADDRQRES